MSTGKFFVGGLSNDTTKETLRRYFEAYGELQSGVVLAEDSQSQGFGFVTFKDPTSLPDNFMSSTHVIDGQQVYVKPSIPESEIHDVDQQARKLILKGLTSKTTSHHLRKHFSQFGEVVHAEVCQENGYPRGKGFVIFATKEDADRALDHTGDHQVNHRVIDVKRAEHNCILPDRTPTPPPQSKATAGDSDKISRPEKVFVGGISRYTTEDSLKEYFSGFGEVLQTEVLRRDGRPRGCGFVIFAKNQAAERVVAQGRHFLDGHLVECKVCEELRRPRPPQTPDPGVGVRPGPTPGDKRRFAQPPPAFFPQQPVFPPAPVLPIPDRLYVVAYANALLRAVGSPAVGPHYPWGVALAPSIPQPPENSVGQMSQYTPY